MAKQWAKRAIVAAVTSLALIIAGCGGAQNNGASSGGSSTGGQPSAAGILADLKSGAKTLRVGTDATFPPFEFTDTSGKMQGFDIDMVNAIAKVVGISKVEFKQITFDGLIPGLQANQFDMVASGVYITDERKKVVDFSDSYFPGGLVLMVRNDEQSINSLDDLKGKKVAVQVGTKSVDWLKQHAPQVQLMTVKTNAEMFQAGMNGQADAVVTGYPAARYYIKQHGGMKIVGKQLTDERYGFVFRKSDSDLRDAVNEALKKLQQDGTYDQLIKKWFGDL